MLPIIDWKESPEKMQIRNLIFPNLSSKTSNLDIKVDDFYIDVKRHHAHKNRVKIANEASKKGTVVLIKDASMKFDKSIIQ